MTDPHPFSTPSTSAVPHARKPGFWLLQNGVLLIGLGLFLLFAAESLNSQNWWAIFIFIPALGLLWGAGLAQHYSRGAFNLWVRLALSSGLIVLTVALIFALGLDWRYAWALMVIAPGLAIFLNGFTRPRLRFGTGWGSAANLLFWLGGSVILLGLTFLLNQLGAINLKAQFGELRWWWVFILLPGLGALLNAAAVYFVAGPGHAANFLALGVVLCAEASAEFMSVEWHWRLPVAIILGGLMILFGGLRRN